MSGAQITGRVALIEDEYTLVINRGADAGVTPGMIFAVFSEDGQVVTDPESGRVLGRLSEEKLRVKVFDVHELFARAETYGTDDHSPPSAEMTDSLRSYEAQLLAAAPIVNGMAELARRAGDVDDVAATAVAPDDVVTINVGDAVELVDGILRHQ